MHRLVSQIPDLAQVNATNRLLVRRISMYFAAHKGKFVAFFPRTRLAARVYLPRRLRSRRMEAFQPPPIRGAPAGAQFIATVASATDSYMALAPAPSLK